MIRIWGRRLRSLESTSYHKIKFQFLASIHNFSSPIENPTYKSRNPFTSSIPDFKTIVTPQIVETTLLNCPSDLVALSFFLWCAKQPDYFHDRLAFNHMVKVITRLTERFENVLRIIKELEQIGCVTKPQTLMLLLRIYWHGEMHKLAIETFEQMLHYGYTPNTYARNILMDIFFKLERVDVALRVLKETQVPNFLSFSIAISNLCKLNNLVHIKDVLQYMLRKGYYLNPDTFSVVLSCYCNSGRLNEALQVLSFMITLGIQLDITLWSMIINAFCKSGNLDIASSLLKKMIKFGYSPNTITFTSLVKGYMESQTPEKAFELFNTMESKGYEPDLVFCNMLIDCFAKMGRYEDACKVYDSFPELKLTPDAYTFCSMLSVICLSNQFVLFPSLLDGVEIEPDLIMCNYLLTYYLKAGCPHEAFEYYDDMIYRNYTPDKYTFVGLLDSLCRSGRTNDAIDVYNGIISRPYLVDSHLHTVIMNSLIKSRELVIAVGFFKEALEKDIPLDNVSYTLGIEALFKNNQGGEVFKYFNKMKKSGLVPGICIYNRLVWVFCKESDVKMVKTVLEEMVNLGIEMDLTTVKILKKLWLRSYPDIKVYKLFVELWESGVLPEEFAKVLCGGSEKISNVSASVG